MTDNTMQKLVSKQADDLFLAEKATAICRYSKRKRF